MQFRSDIFSTTLYIFIFKNEKYLVLEGAVGKLFDNIRELLFGTTPLPVRMLQLRLCLLQLVGHCMVAPLGLDQPLSGLVSQDLLLLKIHLGSLDLLLVLLDGGLGLDVRSVVVLKSNAQLAGIK